MSYVKKKNYCGNNNFFTKSEEVDDVMIFFLYFPSSPKNKLMCVLKSLINPEWSLRVRESHKIYLIFNRNLFRLYVDFFSSIRFLLRAVCAHSVNNDTFIYSEQARKEIFSVLFFSGCCGIFFKTYSLSSSVLNDGICVYIQKVNSKRREP